MKLQLFGLSPLYLLFYMWLLEHRVSHYRGGSWTHYIAKGNRKLPIFSAFVSQDLGVASPIPTLSSSPHPLPSAPSLATSDSAGGLDKGKDAGWGTGLFLTDSWRDVWIKLHIRSMLKYSKKLDSMGRTEQWGVRKCGRQRGKSSYWVMPRMVFTRRLEKSYLLAETSGLAWGVGSWSSCWQKTR